MKGMGRSLSDCAFEGRKHRRNLRRDHRVHGEKRMSRKKVTVVGGGFVGSTTASAAHRRSRTSPIVVLRIFSTVLSGQSARLCGVRADHSRTDSRASGLLDRERRLQRTAGSDVVVDHRGGFSAQAGGNVARRLAERRTTTSVRPSWNRSSSIRRTASSIVVTNPLDAMVQAAFKVSAASEESRARMAGVLDSCAHEFVRRRWSAK